MKITIEIEDVRSSTEDDVLGYVTHPQDTPEFFDGYLVLFDRHYPVRSMELVEP